MLAGFPKVPRASKTSKAALLGLAALALALAAVGLLQVQNETARPRLTTHHHPDTHSLQKPLLSETKHQHHDKPSLKEPLLSETKHQHHGKPSLKEPLPHNSSDDKPLKSDDKPSKNSSFSTNILNTIKNVHKTIDESMNVNGAMTKGVNNLASWIGKVWDEGRKANQRNMYQNHHPYNAKAELYPESIRPKTSNTSRTSNHSKRTTEEPEKHQRPANHQTSDDVPKTKFKSNPNANKTYRSIYDSIPKPKKSNPKKSNRNAGKRHVSIYDDRRLNRLALEETADETQETELAQPNRLALEETADETQETERLNVPVMEAA